MIVCFKKKKISLFYYYSMSSQGKRIVVLTIPAAKIVPTDFDGIRYIRIGSSKENLKYS